MSSDKKKWNKTEKDRKKRPGWFPGNAGNHENTRKFHESDQTLYQTKRDINKLCLGKISLRKRVRIKL